MALFNHYAAYSHCDLELSFLDGWRLLESIGGHKREKSETLIRRAAWFFENSEEKHEIGRHLMERRNLISHGRSIKDENNEVLAFQMKEFIRPLFLSILTNPFGFENLEELWSFCDLPTNRERRARRSYILSCGRKYRRDA